MLLAATHAYQCIKWCACQAQLPARKATARLGGAFTVSPSTCTSVHPVQLQAYPAWWLGGAGTPKCSMVAPAIRQVLRCGAYWVGRLPIYVAV